MLMNVHWMTWIFASSASCSIYMAKIELGHHRGCTKHLMIRRLIGINHDSRCSVILYLFYLSNIFMLIFLKKLASMLSLDSLSMVRLLNWLWCPGSSITHSLSKLTMFRHKACKFWLELLSTGNVLVEMPKMRWCMIHLLARTKVYSLPSITGI
jgi:hypothetical protein